VDGNGHDGNRFKRVGYPSPVPETDPTLPPKAASLCLQPRNLLVRQTSWRAATDDDEYYVYAIAL
jgi:hypothetical protein